MGVPLFGQEHVSRYRETDGEEGHDWQGTTVLRLTTTGRGAGKRLSGSRVLLWAGCGYAARRWTRSRVSEP
jgi:hypothetical protein